MQFERVALKFEREIDSTEINRLFARKGKLRVQYEEFREEVEDDLAKEITSIQGFLDEYAFIRKFDISSIKEAFDISLKKALVEAALKRLFRDGKCDLEEIIKMDAGVFKKEIMKYATITAFILLLKEEVYEDSTSYIRIKEAISRLEDLKS